VGILHRDIKPSNVLLAWSGRAMLLDFNLSVDAAAWSERVGGTPAYMAPELIESLLHGGPDAARRFDARFDIYSLGVVLYELLAGRLPVRPKGDERLPITACLPWLEAKYQAPAALDGTSEVDRKLEAILLKCLAVKPQDRYATATELADGLRRYLGMAGTAARFVKRHRRGAMVACLGLLVGGATFGAFLGNQPTQLERLYREGLSQYERGEFEAAAETFTHCLYLKSGWPEALFGRGQALRRLEKWRDARADFIALEPSDKGWARALAGYCNMRQSDLTAAYFDMKSAHDAGLRDIGFLLNYGRVAFNRQRYSDAVARYSEVLEIDSQNWPALRNRALSHRAIAVVNNSSEIPNPQAFEDAAQDCRLNPDSVEPFYFAAVVLGEASRKDPTYLPEAVRCLSMAIEKGMPYRWIQNHDVSLRHLEVHLDGALIEKAKRAKDIVLSNMPNVEPVTTPSWAEFKGSRLVLAQQ
jgi:tetratricopeptide (TPR) repeat protein